MPRARDPRRNRPGRATYLELEGHLEAGTPTYSRYRFRPLATSYVLAIFASMLVAMTVTPGTGGELADGVIVADKVTILDHVAQSRERAAQERATTRDGGRTKTRDVFPFWHPNSPARLLVTD